MKSLATFALGWTLLLTPTIVIVTLLAPAVPALSDSIVDSVELTFGLHPGNVYPLIAPSGRTVGTVKYIRTEVRSGNEYAVIVKLIK